MMNFTLSKEVKKMVKNKPLAVVGYQIAIENSRIAIKSDSTTEKLYFVDYNNHLENLIQLLPVDSELTILKRFDSNKTQDDKKMHTAKICVIVKKNGKIFYQGLLYQNTVDINMDPYAF